MQEFHIYVIVEWFYIFLTLMLVLNRLYVAASSHSDSMGYRRLATWSDALVAVGWLFNFQQLISDTAVHIIDPDGRIVIWGKLNPKDPEDVKRWKTIGKLLYGQASTFMLALYCVKGSILCFLFELTPPDLRHTRRAICVGFVFVAVGLLATVPIFLFACPPSAWWSIEWYFNGECQALYIGMSTMVSYHVFTDVYIYAIPFFIVYKARAAINTWSQRLATGAMFGAGLLLVVIAIPVLVSDWRDLPGDRMWGYWRSLHELTLAIAVACLPALRVTVIRCAGVFKRRRDSDDDDDVQNRDWFCRGLRRGALSTREVAGDNSFRTSIEPVVAGGVDERTMQLQGSEVVIKVESASSRSTDENV